MKSFQVQEGGLYVNERKSLVREVTQVDGEGNAYWRSFDLSDGKPTGDHLRCSLGTIFQWADREATRDEAARMKRSEITTKEYERGLEFMHGFLERVPDEYLFAEVKRRGRKVI